MQILAKDEEKQRAIREKSIKDAGSAQARAIGATAALSATPAANPPTPTAANRVVPSNSGNVSGTGSSSSKLVSSPSVVAPKTPPAAVTKGRVSMVIQSIPPFKGKKSQPAAQPSNSSTHTTTKASGSGPGAPPTKNAETAKADIAANKLNVNATSFRPNPKAVAFTPVISHHFRPWKLANVPDSPFRLRRTRPWVYQQTRRPKTNPKAYVDFYARCLQTADLMQILSVVLDSTTCP